MSTYPELSHQQYAILSVLVDGEASGQKIRDQIAKLGDHRSGPAFYQMMARLEDAGLVQGWYRQRVIDGQAIKERWYKATGAGQRAWERAREFYLTMAGASIGKGMLNA